MRAKFKVRLAWRIAPLVAAVWLAAGGKGAQTGRLVDAVEHQDKAAVRSLLQQHADVNAGQADGATALHWAAHWDDAETADLLIRAGANVNAANEYGVTPLALACDNGNATMVEKLLNAGANPNVKVLESGETPLMGCARTGNREAVKALLAHGADVNAKETWRGQTALMWAVAERHAETAQTLIENGADVPARSKRGFTALLFAAQQGDLKVAQILLAAGAGVNEATPKDGNTLVVAAAGGHASLASFLLDKNADPDVKDARGATALHYAAANRNMLELVKSLLAHRANPNTRLERNPPNQGEGAITMVGATPFLLAAAAGNAPAMRALAAGGADPRLATVRNTIPLMVAAGVGRYEERTEAQYKNALEAVVAAVESGNDVNAADDNGWTALHGSAYTGANAIIEFLASKGAKMDVKDKFGQTPLSIASAVITAGLGQNADVRPRKYRASTVDVLLKSGATPLAASGVERVGSLTVQ
jgi:ankyrin repeat protein